MKRPIVYFIALSAALLLAGCATTKSGTKAPPKSELTEKYVTTGQDLERQGDLPAALEQYKLALTVDPNHAAAKQHRDRLTDKLSKMADERYSLGMKYYRRGKYGLARKEFLTALKLMPDHAEASKMLVSKQPEKAINYVFHVIKPGESLSKVAKKYYGDHTKYTVIAKFNQIEDATKVKPGQRIMIPELQDMTLPQDHSAMMDDQASYVVHTLQRGESISKLAQMYYGNYKQFHIIAQFNGMDDATRVTVGQKIKVPKVAGLPFHLPQQEQKPSATLETDIAETPTPTQEAPPGDILDEGPTDEVSEMDEQVMAYRDTGIVLYNEGKYEDAVFELNKAIEAAPEDKQTRSYLAKAYFESGKRLFEQQDFKAARDAFESAYQYDPACDACLTMVDKSKSGPVLMRREKGIDLFNQNEYSQAIPELELYLQQRPKDTEIHGLLSKAYFQQALGDYNKGNFQAAQKGFEAALEYDTGCEKCAVYITKSLESFKEEHYNRGIVYFGKENLAEAVSEWQAVYDVDPDYKDVTANLQKAQQLLDKLEQIKKNSR